MRLANIYNLISDYLLLTKKIVLKFMTDENSFDHYASIILSVNY